MDLGCRRPRGDDDDDDGVGVDIGVVAERGAVGRTVRVARSLFDDDVAVPHGTYLDELQGRRPSTRVRQRVHAVVRPAGVYHHPTPTHCIPLTLTLALTLTLTLTPLTPSSSHDDDDDDDISSSPTQLSQTLTLTHTHTLQIEVSDDVELKMALVPRRGHSTTVTSHGLVLVFGGEEVVRPCCDGCDDDGEGEGAGQGQGEVVVTVTNHHHHPDLHLLTGPTTTPNPNTTTTTTTTTTSPATSAVPNKVFAFHPTLLRWSVLRDVRGAPPKARSHHAGVVVGDRLVVVGGQGPRGRTWSMREVYTLDLTTYKWTEHTSSVSVWVDEVPSPRWVGGCGWERKGKERKGKERKLLLPSPT